MWWVLATAALGADQTLLFVGNSYTDRNDLPGLVASLLEEGAPAWTEVEARKLTGGGWTFAMHASELNGGENSHTEALVDGETAFDFVILQEQSQTGGFDQSGGTWQGSLAAAESLDGAIDAHGAETLFYLTWGRRDGDNQNPDRYPDYPTMQGHLNEGYLAYADALSRRKRPVFIAPAGPGFHAIWEDEADPADPASLFYRLYANDGSHPSRVGSMLVAYIFYASITGRAPTDLAYNPDDAISEDDLDILAAVATEVVLDQPFGEMRFPYALTWTEYAGDAAEVTVGGGAIRYQVRVEEPSGPATLTLGEGVLHLQDELEVTDLVAIDRLGEVFFDGGRLLITSESPVSIELASVSGTEGTLQFTGLTSWPTSAFPATVLTASELEVSTLHILVPDGFEATVDEGSVVLSATGAAADVQQRGEGGCGCAHSRGGGAWTGLLCLVVAWRRARGYSRLSISPTSPATT